MRKQFTLQIASICFATHVLCLTSRLPNRFYLSRTTGLIYVSEMYPCRYTLFCRFIGELTAGHRLRA